jgi:hypothetical protein
VEYLLAHPDNIAWDSFSHNDNPLAIEYLLAHPKKIVSWYEISKSPYIFVLDKVKMRETKAELHQDLVKHFLHPQKITKWIASGKDALDYPYFE